MSIACPPCGRPKLLKQFSWRTRRNNVAARLIVATLDYTNIGTNATFRELLSFFYFQLNSTLLTVGVEHIDC